MKSGNLNFLEPSGPLQACNGTALTFNLRRLISNYLIRFYPLHIHSSTLRIGCQNKLRYSNILEVLKKSFSSTPRSPHASLSFRIFKYSDCGFLNPIYIYIFPSRIYSVCCCSIISWFCILWRKVTSSGNIRKYHMCCSLKSSSLLWYGFMQVIFLYMVFPNYFHVT